MLVLADLSSSAGLKQSVLDYVPSKARQSDATVQVNTMMDKALKSGRPELIKELCGAVFKSGRRW
ncbi:hypothetical protein RvY_10967 [Ramazzottius varieornatus]|uniref:Uncharacterized protein n=1 Tax=Ramazzottius varieornatus TaxID=947166 RepID=A0A1D1VMC7_RAMVA|nr:hypothetical protein RvY_10967 [Ramazzottius varieornatus]